MLGEIARPVLGFQIDNIVIKGQAASTIIALMMTKDRFVLIYMPLLQLVMG
jgi:hypothetical protein